MIKVLGLALYGAMAASTRYRLEQYRDGLIEHGIDLRVHYLMGDDYLRARYSNRPIPWMSLLRAGISRLGDVSPRRGFDLAIIYGELLPLLPWICERNRINLPYIYDFDDAFYLKYQLGAKRFIRPMFKGKFDRLIEHAAAVTAGNRHLAAYANRFNENTTLLPTVVDTERFVPLSVIRHAEFTVGWIGSPSTAPYLNQIIEPLSVIAREGSVKLVVIGGAAPAIPGVHVEEIPWSEDSEVALLNQFDVGIMPLPDDDWTKGKCAFKLIQYMACGVPVVASHVGANVDVVTPDCGYLVKNSTEWCDAFRILRDRADMRKEMGRSARLRIVSKYSLQTNLPVLVNVISSLPR